jgi:predicted nucleotidyltransferase
MMQRDFHRLLDRYINGGCFSKVDSIVSALFHDFPFRKNAGKVSAAFQQTKVNNGARQLEFELPAYSGSDDRIVELKNELDRHRQYFVTVVLHGSQADGQLTGYSDVDALVIVKDNVLMRQQDLIAAARLLNRLRIHFHRIDPLQHHGWFVMTEKDLLNFPQQVLPIEVVREACVLTGATKLMVQVDDGIRLSHVQTFVTAVNRMEKLLSKGKLPHSAFTLKSLLSEFMMLPVLYLQAKMKKGMSKRDSFALARHDFSERAWKSMDTVSAVRRIWLFTPNMFQKKFLYGTSGFSWKMRKTIPLSLPLTLKKEIEAINYQEMMVLVHEMKGKATELSSVTSV